MSRENKNLIWAILAFILLITILPKFMWSSWGWRGHGHQEYGEHSDHGMMGGGGYGWVYMYLIVLVFLLLLLVGGYYLFTELRRSESYRSSERALNILKERYARGKITKEQYLKMKEEIESLSM